MRTPLLAVGVVLAAAFATPAVAQAVSVAYIDSGEVWVSSLDGTTKARLASPVVGGDGETEKWLDVAQSDGGRIVAVRNVPGRISRFSSFKIWEPDGTSTVEGPLNAPSGWTSYAYPVGFDITADGKTLVYGYSNSSGCCPMQFESGTYVRPATNSVLDPIKIVGRKWPTLVGDRIVAVESGGNVISVQNAGTSTYGTDFTPWLDTSGTGLEQLRTDIAANGQVAAFEVEAYESGTRTVGKIGVLAVQGIDQPPTFPAAVDCYLPTSGIASGVSLSSDATRIGWQDDAGLRVAGTPSTQADPCVLTAPPALISPTGSHGSIGGADVAAFLPAPTTPTTPTTTTTTPTTTTTTPPPTTPTSPGTGPGGFAAPAAAPLLTIPAKLTARALAASKGVGFKVKVARAGKLTVTATVPASRMGRTGTRAVVVATGSKGATKAGTVIVRLRFTVAARKRVKRLRGARLKLRVVQAGRATTKSVTLR